MNYLKKSLIFLILLTTLVGCESYIDKDGDKRFVMFESSNSKAERYRNQGRELLESSKPDAALEKLQVSARLNATNAEIFHLIGVAYAMMGKYQECLENCNKALQIDNQHIGSLVNRAETFYTIGVAYLMSEKYQEGLENCNKALQIDNQHIGSLVNRGVCHSNLNERELAIADFNEALNIAPNNIEILINRGIELNKIGQKDKACEDIKRAKELGGEISEELFDLVCN